MFLENGLNFLEIAGRWGDQAAGTHHRFGDKGGNRLRTFANDHVVEFLCQSGRELVLALAIQTLAPEMRRTGVQEPVERHVKTLMGVFDARQARRGQRDTVIGLVAPDDLLLFGSAQRIVVVPDDLDLGVIGFRAGIGEEHLAHIARRNGDQLFSQIDGHFVGAMGEALNIGELEHLVVGDLGEAFLAESQRGAPQPGHALDDLIALIIIDINALALIDDERAVLLMRLQIGEGVEVVLDIPGCGRVRGESCAIGRSHGAHLVAE